MTKKRHTALVVLLLAVLSFTVYAPAIQGGYLWDDDDYVSENLNLRTVGGLKKIWGEPHSNPQYYPLVFTSYWIEYRLWGLNPAGSHLINVLLHSLSAALLWAILRRWSMAGALLAAAVFALHPVHVESVAWITERKNVLSGFFYLGALLAYFHFSPPETDAGSAHRRWRFYVLSLTLFLGALLSKTVTATLPAVILLILWWKRGRFGWRDVLPLLPMFIAGAALGSHTANLEKFHVEAIGPEWGYNFLERCLIAGRAFWFYAGKLVWPDPLIFNYPHWHIDPDQWWQYLFPVGAVGSALLLWKMRRRIGRGPLTAVLLFGGTLFPSLGFVDYYPMRYSFVADHFQYLASIGLIVPFAVMVTRLSAYLSKTTNFLRWPLVIGPPLVLGLITWGQSRTYQNVQTLWLDTLAKNPDSFVASINLGILYMDRGDLTLAESHFERALRIKPEDDNALLGLSRVLYGKGNPARGLASRQRALQLRRSRYESILHEYPDYIKALNNLGFTFFQQGDLARAQECFERALQTSPDSAQAHNNLGVILEKRGDPGQAEAHYRSALQVKPDYVEAHNNLGLLYLRLGNILQAAEHFEKALQVNPGFNPARENLIKARDHIERRKATE